MPDSSRNLSASAGLLGRSLPWPASTALLCLAMLPLGWLCNRYGKPGDTSAMVIALIYLLGLTPYFQRRTGVFSLLGILVMLGAGLLIAGLGWLMGGNAIVFVWLGMQWVSRFCTIPTAYGTMIAAQIALEKQQPGHSRWFNSPTEQAQRMQTVYDMFTVLALGALLLWLRSMVV